ncbi:unnamed protein product [Linum tenue]|uniref:Uncharacterized protein n=1 Tax=Linum tenue TaxID=586396 RepID=A0AAV0H5X6_9ROSI|nr:unnamed protein product [Linum tenue]
MKNIRNIRYFYYKTKKTNNIMTIVVKLLEKLRFSLIYNFIIAKI